MADYPVDDIEELVEQALSSFTRRSDNAEAFLDDMQEKIDFCNEEEVSNISLTDRQYSWLCSLANDGD